MPLIRLRPHSQPVLFFPDIDAMFARSLDAVTPELMFMSQTVKPPKGGAHFRRNHTA